MQLATGYLCFRCIGSHADLDVYGVGETEDAGMVGFSSSSFWHCSQQVQQQKMPSQTAFSVGAQAAILEFHI
uniref:Secreted protein n=1 Tax=Ascaris lumbricoides TaxID=6252 RepID=A0A0M3IAZ6_ASCLU